MGRGLLSGLFWGGVASMVVLIFVSIYYPMRELASRQDPVAEARSPAPAPAPAPAPDTRPQVTTLDRSDRETPPLLADPPPPAPGAELADTPPAEPTVPAPADAPAVEPPVRDAPAAVAQPARPQVPPLSERAAQVPAVPEPAQPTRTPDAPEPPVEMEMARLDPDVAAPPAPATRTEPAREAAAGALPSALPPAAIAPAPAPETAPLAEPAPVATALPTPEAAESVAADAPVPAPVPDSPTAPRAAPGLALPLDTILPQRPEGPALPGAPGTPPRPDLPALAMPGVAATSPQPDPARARAEPAPDPAGLAPFSAPQDRTAPVRPELRLAALTQPIVDAAPRPRAQAAPEAAPQTAPEATTDPAPAPGGLPPQADAPAPADDGVARLQTAPRPTAPQSSGLPRRIVLSDGPADGVSRLTARRLTPGQSRLPQIGVTDPAEDPDPGALPEVPSEAPVGAIARNAQPWDGEGPLATIVLQATTPDRAVTDILAGVSAPLAVALDPSWMEAPQRARALRDAGHEVLILLSGLPPQPQPRDIDVALNAHIARLPEAVGVFLPPDNPVAGDRALLSQLAARLAQTGHGLVAQPRGLNTVAQVARAEGTPLAPVSAELPARAGADQTARVLDRALFDAARQGAVVVLGQTQADTLIALRDWVAEPGNTLAPVSAILQQAN